MNKIVASLTTFLLTSISFSFAMFDKVASAALRTASGQSTLVMVPRRQSGQMSMAGGSIPSKARIVCGGIGLGGVAFGMGYTFDELKHALAKGNQNKK